MENQKILVLESHVSCASGIMTECTILICRGPGSTPGKGIYSLSSIYVAGCEREFTDEVIGNDEKVLARSHCSKFRVNGCEIRPAGSLEVVLQVDQRVH